MGKIEDAWKDGYNQGFCESKDAYNRLKYANMNEIRKQKAEIYKLNNELVQHLRQIIILHDALGKAICMLPDDCCGYLSHIFEKCFDIYTQEATTRIIGRANGG